MIRIFINILAAGAAIIVVLAGCQSFTRPVSYYTLSPLVLDATNPAIVDSGPTLTIGIRSVELPGYVSRTQMVRRTGPNQLEVASTERWADYPDRLVQQLLGENLQLLLPRSRVVNAPWAVGLKPDVTISFQFPELIGTTSEKVYLSATWVLTAAAPASTTLSRRTTLVESTHGNGFDDLAAAHSRALAALSRQVADSIQAFQD